MDGPLFTLASRFVLSFERIAAALEGLDETHRRQFERQYPERGQVREAIVTRVPTEEDRLREAQGGADGQSIEDWLGLEDEEEDIGIREREWLETHPGA